MTQQDELSAKDKEIIAEALSRSSEEPPELISRRILKAATDKVESKTKRKQMNKTAESKWFKLMPIAASVVISFYAGKYFQVLSPVSTNDTSFVFQGDKSIKSVSEQQGWTEDRLLKEIAEAALAGDIERVEMLVKLYKEKYSKDSQ